MGSDVKVMRPYDFIDHDEECPTCSAKKCDNLLVETDIVFHFRGLILCNAKRLQFHRYKKGKREVTFQKLFYALTLYFEIDGVVASVCVAQKNSSLRRLHRPF